MDSIQVWIVGLIVAAMTGLLDAFWLGLNDFLASLGL
jgi:predicted outer membrane lipoprotein